MSKKKILKSLKKSIKELSFEERELHYRANVIKANQAVLNENPKLAEYFDHLAALHYSHRFDSNE